MKLESTKKAVRKGVVKKAIRFAAEAHKGQRRKYTGEPYIVHPISVLSIVESVEHDRNMQIAAVLHDTVEDTEVTFDNIITTFGWDVASMVYFLTDISKPEDGNRATRKEMDALHNARGSSRVQTIKVADLLDNTKSIKEHDPNFWRVYRKEKIRLLELLTKADPILLEKAWKVVEE